MPFKDTPEGQTHSFNDGCGEPAHNCTHKYSQEDGYCHICFNKQLTEPKNPEEKLVKTCTGLDCPERTGGECTAGDNMPMFTFKEYKEILLTDLLLKMQKLPIEFPEKESDDYDAGASRLRAECMFIVKEVLLGGDNKQNNG